MIDISIINSIIKLLFINTCTNYIFIKSTINKKIKKLEHFALVLNSIIVAIVFAFLRNYIDVLIVFIISYTLYSLIMKIITKRIFSNVILITIISVSMSILFMGISSIINFFLIEFIPFYNENVPFIEYIIIGLMQILLTYLFFKIKRFQHGLSFLRDSSKTQDINYLGAIIGIFSLLLCILFGMVEDITIRTYFTLSLIVLGFALYKWIHQQMKKYYQYEIIDETINSLKSEIEMLKSKLSITLKLNHNYSHRISALESAIKDSNVEFSQEIAPNLAKAIKNLSDDFRNEINKTQGSKTLSSTNVYAIDNILSYMLKEAEKYGIKFNVQVNQSINYIIENIIPEGKFITMLSNHIKNSIIAINSNESVDKSILVILGLIDNSYGICIYDTGIEFEIETLSKLGLEEVTTYKDGTGIGFMTTFEILNEYNASIIIEENAPNLSKYTKSITIKFDNKNEYNICSYRATELKTLCSNPKIKIESR